MPCPRLHYPPAPHQHFNPDYHSKLYINLTKLPKGTHYFCTNDYTLPVFIIAPIHVLLKYVHFGEVSFINRINAHLQYNPSPLRVDCSVCFYVNWLVNHNPDYGEAMRTLSQCEPEMVFEVAREVWCRLNPKPLTFSWFHFLQTKCTHLNQILRDRFSLNPGVWQDLHRERNLINILTHMDFLRTQEGIMRQTAEQVFAFLLACVFQLTLRFSRIPPRDGDGPLYVLTVAARRSIGVHEEIALLALVVATAFTRFDGDRWVNYFKCRKERPNEKHWFALSKMVSNIFMCNCTAACTAKELPEWTIVHKNNCEIDPDSCWCDKLRAIDAIIRQEGIESYVHQRHVNG